MQRVERSLFWCRRKTKQTESRYLEIWPERKSQKMELRCTDRWQRWRIGFLPLVPSWRAGDRAVLWLGGSRMNGWVAKQYSEQTVVATIDKLYADLCLDMWDVGSRLYLFQMVQTKHSFLFWFASVDVPPPHKPGPYFWIQAAVWSLVFSF